MLRDARIKRAKKLRAASVLDDLDDLVSDADVDTNAKFDALLVLAQSLYDWRDPESAAALWAHLHQITALVEKDWQEGIQRA